MRRRERGKAKEKREARERQSVRQERSNEGDENVTYVWKSPQVQAVFTYISVTRGRFFDVGVKI